MTKRHASSGKHFKVTEIKSGKHKGKYKVQMRSGQSVLFTADEPKARPDHVLRFCRAVNPSLPVIGLN